MTTIGYYKLQDELGRGGMGTVYRGTDSRSQQIVAIKHLKSEIAQPETIERFKREGEALRELNHPNIVKMLDMFEHDGQHYLVMEYISGGDLKDLIYKNGTIDYQQCVDMAIDLADALTRAHRLNIIHRDLKPANVLIGDDGVLRLTDFGVAHVGSKERVTDTDAIVGTIDYLPPEAFSGQQYDARGDIWAFGVMLFEMLTGQRPFTGNLIAETLNAILTAPIPDLEQLCPDAPIALVDLVYRMLERDPRMRIASVRHVGAALEDILEERSTTPQTARFDTDIPDLSTLPKHNLPAETTPFVGREHELTELENILKDPSIRLITILGAGGMGKTRLAVEIAERYISQVVDGVYLVELAPLSTVDNIVSAIASAVEYPFLSDERTFKQQLLDFFREKNLLLVMDNFEHLIEGATLVADILQAAPHIQILATSRERLNLQEETLFRVEGMDFPDWETPDDAIEYSAVKLFLQSARRVQPDFELKAENLPYVARICRIVQGLPLGIVLAAAWVDALMLEEIADEISTNVNSLETEARNIPERHRSIRAVFDYSWNLMTEVERDVFSKLSIFRGGFTRKSANAVVGAGLRTLISLTNKSLIRRSADSGRYDIHELTRQYGEDHLKQADNFAEIQIAYAEYFADFMTEHYLDIKGGRQLDALDDIDIDFDNIQTVWYWACQHPKANIIDRMVDGYYWYQDIRGQYREGIENLLLAESVLKGTQDTIFHRVRIRRLRHAILASLQDDLDIDSLFESLEFVRSHDYTAEVAFCLFVIGGMYQLWEDNEKSIPYCDEAYELYEQLDDRFYMSEVMLLQALNKRSQGKINEVYVMLNQILEIKLEINDLNGTGWVRFNLGIIAAQLRDYDTALHNAKQGIEIMRRLKTMYGLVTFSNLLSWTALIKGNLTETRDIAQRSLTWAKEKNYQMGIVQALTVLGTIIGILEKDTEIAQEIVHTLRKASQNVIAYATFPGQIELCLAMTALSLNDYETTKAEFVNCMKLFPPVYEPLFSMVVIFALKALLDAYDGQPEQAIKWLRVAFHHPYQDSLWLADWQLITDLQANLKLQLDETTYNTIWESGTSLDMESTVQTLLEEYRSDV